MNIDAKVGGRRVRNDPRDLRNWVGNLKLKATREGDQFLLAAVYSLLMGTSTKRLKNALFAEAERIRKQHRKREKETGLCATISEES